MPIINKKIINSQKEGGDPFIIKSGRFKGLKEDLYSKTWTEDAFVSFDGDKEMVGKGFDNKRTPIIGGVLLFFLFFLMSRVVWLQIVKGEHYYSIAEGNRIRVERVEAKRGIIYDQNYNSLVRNVPNFLLYFLPADLPEGEDLDIVLRKIEKILGPESLQDARKSLSEIKPRSLDSFQPVFVADNIEYEKAMALYLESESWGGVILSSKTRREYDLHDSLSLSHILGYTGKVNKTELEIKPEYSPIDYIGKMGLEYFWESDLRGNYGKKQIEVDALGKEKKIINQTEQEDGYNLVLSLDVAMQREVENILKRQLLAVSSKRAVVIVSDPSNGGILAMVSLPTFDNNDFALGINTEKYSQIINDQDLPLFNRAISGEYPPGSTFKLVMSAAALEDKIINENTSINSTGGINVGQWFFPDWKAGGHGITNARKAIAESVNTFFYYVGGGYGEFRGLGIEKIVNYAKLFNLGEQTGVDLPGEKRGFLPSKEWKEETKDELWYIGDTYHLSIGQGDLLVTPLQVSAYTSFFANGGKLYQPHLVKEILSGNDELVRKIEDSPIREGFIEEKNVEIVRQGMRQAVTSGSARSLADLPVKVAGKTGTAQWSSKKPPHAWFTGFAPYSDPEIVVTVLVEEGIEGSGISTRIAKDIFYWYFTRN